MTDHTETGHRGTRQHRDMTGETDQDDTENNDQNHSRNCKTSNINP